MAAAITASHMWKDTHYIVGYYFTSMSLPVDIIEQLVTQFALNTLLIHLYGNEPLLRGYTFQQNLVKAMLYYDKIISNPLTKFPFVSILDFLQVSV